MAENRRALPFGEPPEVVLKYRIHPGQVSCRKLREQCLEYLPLDFCLSKGGRHPRTCRFG